MGFHQPGRAAARAGCEARRTRPPPRQQRRGGRPWAEAASAQCLRALLRRRRSAPGRRKRGWERSWGTHLVSLLIGIHRSHTHAVDGCRGSRRAEAGREHPAARAARARPGVQNWGALLYAAPRRSNQWGTRVSSRACARPFGGSREMLLSLLGAARGRDPLPTGVLSFPHPRDAIRIASGHPPRGSSVHSVRQYAGCDCSLPAPGLPAHDTKNASHE